MHEMSLIHDLMEKIADVAKENNAVRIYKVTVAIGALAHISGSHFREHFEEAAVGTMAEGAELEVIEGSDIHDPHAQEILLRSVELETAED